MKLIPRSNDRVTWGMWTPWLLAGGGYSASICCPECGHFSVLTDHEIDADGRVQPSVVCPVDSCTFHEFIQLEDWDIK